MNPLEWRTAVTLSAVYALRMLGMFLLLPVFALYAPTLEHGNEAMWVGLAFGAYGLTQAFLQLPFGMASDKYGRKPVIYFGLLLFAAGSFWAAHAQSIEALTWARALQGAGAVSAAVTALLADLTREQVRTRAMAMIGLSIGLTFAVSLVLGPLLAHGIGVDGIFTLTGVLTLLAMVTIHFAVPNPQRQRIHADAEVQAAVLPQVLRHGQLWRLNFGVFALHAAQMALFMAIPLVLVRLGLPKGLHWQIYLPAVLAGLVLMIPAVIVGETKNKLKPVFVAAIGLLLAAQLSLALGLAHLWAVAASLVVYFIGFNIVEATLPSLVSKITPSATKGTAMGVYNTLQSVGLFVGGAAGGVILSHFGLGGIFVFCTVLMVLWLAVAATAAAPKPVRNLLLPVADIWQGRLKPLHCALMNVAGVEEIAFSDDGQTVYLKVLQQGFDDLAANSILSGDKHVSE